MFTTRTPDRASLPNHARADHVCTSSLDGFPGPRTSLRPHCAQPSASSGECRTFRQSRRPQPAAPNKSLARRPTRAGCGGSVAGVVLVSGLEPTRSLGAPSYEVPLRYPRHPCPAGVPGSSRSQTCDVGSPADRVSTWAARLGRGRGTGHARFARIAAERPAANPYQVWCRVVPGTKARRDTSHRAFCFPC